MKQDREAVKTLAIAVGVREAARQLGLNENTVVSWSKRDNWQIATPKPNGPPRMQSAIKPSDALQRTLQQRREKSKLHLSEYVEKASQQASSLQGRALLRESKQVKNVADIRSSVWPIEQEGSGVLSPLQVFSGQTVIQVTQRSSNSPADV